KHLESFHSEFPGVRGTFHKFVKETVQKTRCLTSPFGRRRLFFDRMNDELLRSAISHIPQSTVADWMDFGILRAQLFSQANFNAHSGSHLSSFFALDSKYYSSDPRELVGSFIPCVQSHDGLLVQCRIEDIRRTIKLLSAALTYEIPFR